jgi:hypothetical protein
MQDDPPPPADELWGLARYSDNPLDSNASRLRPAYAAFRVVAQYMSGADWVRMANVLRPNTCGLPRDARLRPCYQRYAPRYDWAANYVAFQKGNRRANVLWNQTDQPLTVTLAKRGTAATVVDKRGNQTPLSAQGDRWVVTLAPAQRHFDLFGGDPPGYFYIGGPTIIVVEQGVPPDAPVEPPRRS